MGWCVRCRTDRGLTPLEYFQCGRGSNAIGERRVTDVETYFNREMEHGAFDESARGYVEALRAIEQVRGGRLDPEDSRNSI